MKFASKSTTTKRKQFIRLFTACYCTAVTSIFLATVAHAEPQPPMFEYNKLVSDFSQKGIPSELSNEYRLNYGKIQRLKRQSLNDFFRSKKYRSRKNQDIEIFAAKTKDPTHRFLVQGGIHGNEVVAQKFVLWLAKRYSEGKSLLNHFPREIVAIDFLPYANPDGIKTNSRNNSTQTNLNRNFGVLWGISKENPGKHAFSEPETSAIRDLFRKRNYTGAVDVHGYINWVVAPSEPKYIKKKYKDSLKKNQNYSKWISSLKANLKTLGKYELKTAGGLGDGGAFEDWAFWEFGSLPFCLELESNRRWISQKPKGTKTSSVKPKIDSFKKYEKYIYEMFKKAIEIKTEKSLASN